MSDLAQRVEAGEWDEPAISKALGFNGIALGLGDARSGSIDAAKMLLEEVLPGWGWKAMGDSKITFLTIWKGGEEEFDTAKHFGGEAPTTTAALMAAMLRALT